MLLNACITAQYEFVVNTVLQANAHIIRAEFSAILQQGVKVRFIYVGDNLFHRLIRRQLCQRQGMAMVFIHMIEHAV